MVVYVLYIKADLESVASVALQPGANLSVSVRNPLDVNQVRKIVIDMSALEPEVAAKEHMKNTHAEAPCHFALKWDHDEQTRSTIHVLGLSSTAATTGNNKKSKKSKVPPVREMKGSDSGSFVPMLALDCQGIEPFAFHPMANEFLVTNSAGVQFQEVDLSSGDWDAYDLSTGTTSVMSLQAKFE
jgi:hypothetical protein